MVPQASVLITDLDNTLWDWVEIWHRSFSALLDTLVDQSGIDRDVLEQEIRAIHQHHGTSEYAFVINEIGSLQNQHPDEDLSVVYKDAITAYRKARNESLRLYPTVFDTLHTVKSKGSLVIAYTESMAFYTCERIRKLGLDDVIDYLYSPADHELPKGLNPDQIRLYPKDHYEFKSTQHRHTPPGALKPDATILRKIVEDHNASPQSVVYVGDSLMKDIYMAQRAGVPDVWAKYGIAQSRPEYELLRRVSHWSDDAVQREKDLLRDTAIDPTYVVSDAFKELLDLFEFIPHDPGGPHAR